MNWLDYPQSSTGLVTWQAMATKWEMVSAATARDINNLANTGLQRMLWWVFWVVQSIRTGLTVPLSAEVGNESVNHDTCDRSRRPLAYRMLYTQVHRGLAAAHRELGTAHTSSKPGTPEPLSAQLLIHHPARSRPGFEGSTRRCSQWIHPIPLELKQPDPPF